MPTIRPVTVALLLAAPLAAQAPRDSVVPDLATLISARQSELAPVLERWNLDRNALGRRYSVAYSPERQARLGRYQNAWQGELERLAFGTLSREAQVDAVLLHNRVRYEQQVLAREAALFAEMAPMLPFADTLFAMLEARRQLVRPDPEVAARRIASMLDALAAARERLTAANAVKPSRSAALRAAETTADLRRQFQGWQRFYIGYDPELTWRLSEPAKRFDSELEKWRTFLREQIVGVKPGQDEPIVGDPIGATGLADDLANEMIAYTPAELLAIAEREFAYLEGEARRAARDMGLGDDWKAALERTKRDYPEVGGQTAAVRDMAWEAIDWVESRNLVTVPPLAKEIWRMEMMSAEAQKTNPFFLGGEVIQVSSPTDGQTEEEKAMALRANNRHFSRATVHHELIPGHHLQGFAAARTNTHRGIFYTPFYVEGWALWWEIHMWDLGFPRTPENRMGMLFWRMHRAARIIFSLKFHLGEWTPEQCIDFLVDRVGHERASATGEVRRSFNGNYSPLYQAGYLLGGMQLRALHTEVVGSGRMTEREFHDAVLATGPMPIEMVRALLVPSVPLRMGQRASWRFAE
ncbi:MAG: DUF885 family protein [Gemmatimonadales bacterium]|nr:DUF885 family protein [Gemmatimonadales bacterium]MDZ4390813.1 DUF885 family protein [Gemmatimonadales bacterium]